MKKEVMDAMEAAKQELILRILRQEREFAQQASKLEERGDYKAALRYALDLRKARKKRLEIENSDTAQVVFKNDDAFEFFLDCVKRYVLSRMKTIYHQLFLSVMRPWEANKATLFSALLDIELVASDLSRFADRYPSLLQAYIEQLHAVTADVEAILNEIA